MFVIKNKYNNFIFGNHTTVGLSCDARQFPSLVAAQEFLENEYPATKNSYKIVPICRKCSGEMKEGIALQNGISYGLPDFVGDDLHSMSEKELRGQTFSYSGQAVEVAVWKCPHCGHSFTK